MAELPTAVVSEGAGERPVGQHADQGGGEGVDHLSQHEDGAGLGAGHSDHGVQEQEGVREPHGGAHVVEDVSHAVRSPRHDAQSLGSLPRDQRRLFTTRRGGGRLCERHRVSFPLRGHLQLAPSSTHPETHIICTS